MRAARAAVWLAAGAAVTGAIHAALNSRHLRHLSEEGPSVPVSVSVLVPARNESGTIAHLIGDLRAQTGLPDLQIVVLDDDSSDDTAAVATAAAAGDARVRVERRTSAPPPGWLGKAHACRCLADMAHGRILVFLDADVRVRPGAVAAAVTDLTTSGSALLSAWPRQLAITPLAVLLQPLQQWSWLTTLPLSVAARSQRATMAAANGQFLAIEADAYERIGGHAAVADQVLEDIGLARAVKRAGLRADLVDASAVAECLMYRTDSELLAGYQKSLWTSFGGSWRSVIATTALACLYAAPPAYAIAGRHTPTRIIGLVGYSAAVANRVVAARSTGGVAWPSSAGHPVAMIALAGLAAASAVRRRFGRLTWRGRPV